MGAVLILMGEEVMLFSIIKGPACAHSFLPEGSRMDISRSLNLHPGLMLVSCLATAWWPTPLSSESTF
jgi:hypothetical protein